MAKKASAARSMRSLFYIMLGTPVLVCIGMGLLFSLSDPKQGIFLIVLGLGLGGINFLILRVVLRKLEESEQEEGDPS